MSAPGDAAALTRVLAKAFAQVPSAEANQAIDRVREELSFDGPLPVSYEVLLPPFEPARDLVERVLPQLVYFLDCRGAKLPRAHGVFVSMFVDDQLYFFSAGDLVLELAEWLGLTSAQLIERWGASSV